MSDTLAIKALSNTLKKLLKEIEELKEENIVFDSPADIEPTGNTMLSIHLFQILPNGYLKKIQPIILSEEEKKKKPIVVDLFYLFTPYAKTKETEMVILEKVIRKLGENSVLKQDRLPKELGLAENEELKLVPYALSLEDLNKLWGIFSGKDYKTLLSYILTPVKIYCK